MSNWHRAQLAIIDKPYLEGTQRSPLTSQLLCVWLAVSNAHFPVLSRKRSESVKTKISTAHISKAKTNFSKIPSKLFSGLQNLVIEINLSRHFSWPLNTIENFRACNQGIRAKDQSMATYRQYKNALTYFYSKRKVLGDGRLTVPLDIWELCIYQWQRLFTWTFDTSYDLYIEEKETETLTHFIRICYVRFSITINNPDLSYYT